MVTMIFLPGILVSSSMCLVLSGKQDSVQFLVDDHMYVSGSSANVTSGTYPFNGPFFFIFNVAVGGNWPGPPDNTTIFPQRMFVDYVRVFQQ
jgi:beta-glucanase (GH16 family)